MGMTATQLAAAVAAGMTPQQIAAMQTQSALSHLTTAQISAMQKGEPFFRKSGDNSVMQKYAPGTKLPNGQYRCDLGDGVQVTTQENFELHLQHTHKL